MMYAFSRACMVFTTANSSAMLSYLRRVCPSGGRQGPRSPGPSCGKTLHSAQPDRRPPDPQCGPGAAARALDSLLPLPGVLVQLHFLPERGAVWAPGAAHPSVLLVSALQAGARHSPRTVPACFQGLQQSRRGSGRPVRPPGPSNTTPWALSARAWGCCQLVGRLGPGPPHSTTALWLPHPPAGRPYPAHSDAIGHTCLSHAP